MCARPAERRACEGAALVEFALVFPVQLFITLAIMQLALLYIGNQVVDYAAFCAARSLLVEPNDVQAAESAAEFTCSVVTGDSMRGQASDSMTVPGWGRLRRSGVSARKTSIRVLDSGGSGTGEVVVEVVHDFELVIPVVNEVLAERWKNFIWLDSGEPRGEAYSRFNRALSQSYGAPHVRIVRKCILAKPWR